MRVVFDTGVVVSALLFTEGRLSWLRGHWRRSDVTPLASHATVDELIRVLSYPRFGLGKSDIEALLGDYLPFTEVVTVRSTAKHAPRCREGNDQMFVYLAMQGRAGALVSGDAAVRERRGLERGRGHGGTQARTQTGGSGGERTGGRVRRRSRAR